MTDCSVDEDLQDGEDSLNQLSARLGTIRITTQRGRAEKLENHRPWHNKPEAIINTSKDVLKTQVIGMSTRSVC